MAAMHHLQPNRVYIPIIKPCYQQNTTTLTISRWYIDGTFSNIQYDESSRILMTVKLKMQKKIYTYQKKHAIQKQITLNDLWMKYCTIKNPNIRIFKPVC